ncbi:MAG: tripartite tricarboxylate transporter substrate binding protein BugD [Alphaproteobacteria bacterium]|nr:tripartite tricarboxylate transporter substrate binding protein BugD [Alphaproteobacteria bacterium]
MTASRVLTFMMALAALAGAAQAQDYPTRPVTMVVSAAAGGPIDVFGRLLAERMAGPLGQRVVIENVGGGGGTVGGGRVAKAEPNGYTSLLGTIATHTNPLLHTEKRPYDPVADFVPVGLVAEIPLILIARKDFPANTFEEFVAYAKANQGKMNYGSAGVGSAAHLGCVMLERAMGVKIQHVPYRGTALAMQDLVAGRLDFLCEIAVTAVKNIQSGTVKGLANLSRARTPVLPDLPTAAEKGLPSVQAYTWTAVFLPKGTPQPIADRLNAATVAAMNAPGLHEQLQNLAATLVAPDRRSPDYLGRFVREEFAKWGEAIRAGGALPQ